MIKDFRPKILFKYEEYVDVWTDMIFEYLEDIDVLLMGGDVKDTPDSSFRSVVFLTFLSVNSLEVGSKINESIRSNLEKDLIDNVIQKIFLQQTDQKSQFSLAFKHKYDEFAKLFGVVSKDMEVDNVVLSFARIILNLKVLKQTDNDILITLNKKINEAILNFDKLARNSAASLKILGKPNFVVEKD